MASRVIGYVRGERADGLCDRCYLPSLIHITLILLLASGVVEHDRGNKCLHCDLNR